MASYSRHDLRTLNQTDLTLTFYRDRLRALQELCTECLFGTCTGCTFTSPSKVASRLPRRSRHAVSIFIAID